MYSSRHHVFRLFAVCALLLLHILMPAEAALTEEQMQQAANGLRTMCQSKFKVDDELVDGIKTGQFPNVAELKCYVNCVLEMMQISKRGTINYDGSLKMINSMLPEKLREDWTRGLTMCKDEKGDTNDKCDASYMVLQCFQSNIPTFIFP